MSVYFGVVVSEELFFQSIAYKKFGKRDLKLLAESIEFSELSNSIKRNLNRLYEKDKYLEFLILYESVTTKLSDYVCDVGKLCVFNLDGTESPYFIGINEDIPEKLLLPSELDSLIVREKKDKVIRRLSELGLGDIPSSLTIGIAKYQSELEPPSNYVPEKKDKL